MGYLLLAIFCSAMISITMRLSSGKVGSHFSMLAANYLVCGILGAVYADFSLLATETDGIGLTVGLAVLNGAMLLGGLILLQISTRKNGVVLSSLFMKLGLLVPFAASILFFHEMPTWLQVAGFCLAIAAIVVFNLKKDGANSRFGIGLILLLLLNGGVDTAIKTFEALGPAALSDHFLCFSFSVAFVLCMGLVMAKRERPDGKALLYGAAIGVVNFFSSKFVMGALTQIPAVVLFPTYSVATMLVVTLCGVIFFRERLSKRQWLAFGGVIAALVMLNI
jgi:drug/metabolite transporter (DMT)-like permease